MKLARDTITVFNMRLDGNGYTVYVPTVIKNVSWYGSVVSNVSETGLIAANSYTIRIPMDADFGGKVYVDSVTYKEESIVAGIFTLAAGDIIVKGEVAESMTPAQLHATYQDCCTILGVTDNRRAPNAPHFRVVGK